MGLWLVLQNALGFNLLTLINVLSLLTCSCLMHPRPNHNWVMAVHRSSSEVWRSAEGPSTLSILSLRDWPFAPLPSSTGESDEDDVCLGIVSWPRGAEPQRSLETPGHLRLQHWAGPLGGGGGGGGTQVKRLIWDTNYEEEQKIQGCAWKTCTYRLTHTLTSECAHAAVLCQRLFLHTHISDRYPEDSCAHVYIHLL